MPVRIFSRKASKIAHGHNIHLTPYLPTIEVLKFPSLFVGRKAMDIIMNDKLKKLISSLDQNQIAEINRFLNSADGQRFKNNISERDKANILNQINTMDPAKLRRTFSGLSKEDLVRMLNQRK